MTESSVRAETINGTQFVGVDRSDDPQSRVRYLDMVAKSIDYKRDSIRALALGPVDRVLDIGCGTGDDVRLMAELVVPAGRAVGLDVSETMGAEARRRGTGGGQSAPIEFQQGDIYALPFPDGVFDATRADRVFQHLTEPVAGLTEMRRVTRPGGVVSAIDPDWDTLVVDVSNRALFRKIFSHDLGAHAGRNSGSQLFGLFHLRSIQPTGESERGRRRSLRGGDDHRRRARGRAGHTGCAGGGRALLRRTGRHRHRWQQARTSSMN